MNFTGNVHAILQLGYAAAGQTTLTPAAGVDLRDHEGCLFLITWGTITAGTTTSAVVYQSSDDGVLDAYTDLVGASVIVTDADSDLLTTIEVVQPSKRYLKCVVARDVENAELVSVVALVYGGSRFPLSAVADSVLQQALVQTPAEVVAP